MKSLKNLSIIRVINQILRKLIEIIKALRAQPALQPKVEPKVELPPEVIEKIIEPQPNIKELAYAMGSVETNYFYTKSLGMRNNNPLNLKFAGQAHATKDGRGFCIFPTLEIGWQAAYNQLKAVCEGRSAVYNSHAIKLKLKDAGELTLGQFIHVFAPTSDGNYPDIYAARVAKDLKITTGFLMKDFL